MRKIPSGRGTGKGAGILGLVLSLAVLGGVAVAQTTAASTIVACVHKTTGHLRVVGSADDCKSQETVLEWSRDGGTSVGPEGPEGPEGPRGPEGPQGPPGISVAGQRCPAGQFVVGFEADGDLICEAVGGSGGETTTFYRDADSDGYGDPAQTIQATTAPAGYVQDNTDCNDNNNAVHPGAPEAANGVDDNCNGDADEGVEPTTTFYRDADNDGYGNPAVTQTTYAPGWVEDNTDCDDARSATNPGAQEVVGNLIDDNCNGETDEGLVYLESFTLTPQQIFARTGGFSDTLVDTHSVGKVTLQSPLAGDVAIDLSAEMSPEGAVSLPDAIVIPAGQTEAEFNVIGLAPGFAEITATLNGNSLTQQLEVREQDFGF